MSIRVTSSGHNFSQDATTMPSDDLPVRILIESPKAMLIPTTLINEESLEDELQAAGIDINPDEESVVVVTQDEVTSAIIVLPSPLLGEIQATCGNRVSYTTPLLAPSPSRGHDVLVHLSEDGGLLCIALFNGGDRLFAELFEVKGYADVLYWLTRVGEGYDLSEYTIYIDGKESELTKLLKNYYKSVVEICE